MSMTVDGFVAGPKGESDWLFANSDPSADQWSVKTAWQAGAHVMGSKSFHDMAGWWPSSTEIFAPPMNPIPKVVFSKDTDVTAKSRWTKVEANGDGKISADEHAAGAKKMFDKMDTDKDGYLSKSEMEAGHARMMSKMSAKGSDKPSADAPTK